MNTSHTSGRENCGCSCCASGASPIVSRPRYFPRQLITPDDLSLEADYFRDALRRMRRMLWGYGVVCGAVVCPAPKCNPDPAAKKQESIPGAPAEGTMQATPTAKKECEWEPWTVVIKKGYILGPCGDEIIVPCDYRWDVRQGLATSSNGDPCPEPCDPWCTQTEKHHTDRYYCVAIKYKQVMARPVRVQPVGCGCEDAPCEYSRWCDGYELALREPEECCHENSDHLSTEHGGSEEIRQELARLPKREMEGVPPCPPCPESPWLCLARIKFDPCGCIIYLGNCDCRRLAISFHSHFWKCHHEVCCDVDHRETEQPREQADKDKRGEKEKELAASTLAAQQVPKIVSGGQAGIPNKKKKKKK